MHTVRDWNSPVGIYRVGFSEHVPSFRVTKNNPLTTAVFDHRWAATSNSLNYVIINNDQQAFVNFTIH